jgi:hypothetical protein
VYTDNKGRFHADLDDGAYTVVASNGEKYALVNNLAAGGDDGRDMLVSLQDPGAVKGEIANAVELRGSGSIVVRIMGTDIFTVVDNDGTFTLDNVPAGDVTLASYSTSISQFSPIYQNLTVVPDSVRDLKSYELDFNGIPIPKGVKVAYDSLKQTVRISWNAIDDYPDFQEYAVLRGVGGKAEHDLKQIAYTVDTVFVDQIVFSTLDTVSYEYAVRVNNKLGQYGQYYGIFSVTTRPFQSPVNAGEDLIADIATNVKLLGKIDGPKCPILTMQWKIGAADWVKSDSGEAAFTTASSLAPDTTVCVFRVTDSLGNVLADTALVKKEMRISSYGRLPGVLPDTNGYPELVKFKGKYWRIAGSASASFSSWSTADFTAWSLEKASCPITNCGGYYGQFLAFKDQLFIVNLDSNLLDFPQLASYRSDNGRDWTPITPVPPPLSSTKADSTFRVPSFYHLRSRIIEFHSKLFALLEISAQDTNGTGSFFMHLVSSPDGITWNCVGTIPGFDYRFSYSLLASGDKLYFVSLPGGLRYGERFRHKEIYRSADEGKTWERDLLWDADEDANSDMIHFMRASDSVVFASYAENGSTEKESFRINGKWTDIPSEIVEKQRFQSDLFWNKARQNDWQQIGIPSWLDGNRLFWIDPADSVKSIKLF